MRTSIAALLLGLLACNNSAPPAAPVTTPAEIASSPAVAPPPAETPVAETSAWPHSAPKVERSTRGMVVTDEARATRVGQAILAEGGNAVDAAVAVAFALAVTFPTAGNLGGGGFAVIKHGDKQSALDFREIAPKASKHDMFVGADGKPQADAYKGIRSAGVPGSVAGLWELHARHGSKRWSEVLAPAIALAKQGFEVDEAFHSSIARSQEKLAAHPIAARLFLPGGAPPKVGSVFANPDLASTLIRISASGPKGFYTGINAKNLASQMKAEGGIITEADLASYKAKWREPIRFRYRGAEIVSMPPPSAGGITMAMMANILEGVDLKAKGFGSVDTLHFTIEAMRRSFAARNTLLGDPDFVKNPLDRLLSPQWAAEQRAGIDPIKATPSSQIPSGQASGAGPHTTHFSVVDAKGDAVALTTTVNHWYGSGIAVKDGGYVLNNEMDDFASVPGEANAFGLVQGEANAIAPGKRMLSSMTPSLVFGADGQLRLVVGAAGGPTIITSTFQQIQAVLDFDKSIGEAVYAPRVHMQHLPDMVITEEGGLSEATQAELRKRGYTLNERGHIADAPAIGREGAEWVGVAEPRREGGLAAGL